MECIPMPGKQAAYDPTESGEIEVIEQKAVAAVTRFGNGFESDFGWAVVATYKSRPKFSDLEDAVGLDHLRAHYRLADDNVHANPKGTFFKLGLLGKWTFCWLDPPMPVLPIRAKLRHFSEPDFSSALLPLQLTFDNLVALSGDAGCRL
jgi:hypothetical protein